MSAYVVSKETIDVIVTYAMKWEMNHVIVMDRENSKFDAPVLSVVEMTPDELGQWLWKANLESVVARYGDIDDLPGSTYDFEYEFNGHQIDHTNDAAAMAKIIHHYCYQSCETPTWYLSDQRMFCNELLSTAFRDLEGYEEAPWGI